MIPLQEPRKPGAFSLFNLGFRPFFLAGGIAALALIALWLQALKSGWTPAYYQSGVFWHGHEMIFGFSLAIIAGFLLTAVRNWTNVQTPTGWSLGGIFAVWLLARLLPFIPDVPGSLIALMNAGFPILVALGIGIPIIRSGNYRNLIFLGGMAGFLIASLLVHLQLLGLTNNSLHSGLYLALYMVIAIIVVIGGRVIPFFTERGIGDVSCTRYSWLEKALLPLTVLWLLSQLVLPGYLAAATSLVLFALQLLRLKGWYQPGIWQHPLLWILHGGYAFLVLGIGLQALAQAGLLSQSIATHAFATGAIGGLTLGMMARVSLGHTGRTLQVNWMMKAAFASMLISALLRISVEILPLPWYTALHISGGFWMIAWLLFTIRYSKMLITPRADGLWG